VHFQVASGSPYAFNQDSKVVLHRHEFFELAYMYRGRGTHYYVGGEKELLPQNIFFMGPNVFHETTVETGACLINIIIRPEMLNASFISMISDADVFSDYLSEYFFKIQQSDDFLYFDGANMDYTHTLIKNMVIEIHNKEKGWDSVCQSLLTLLFTNLSRTYAEQRYQYDDPIIREIISIINKNYHSITLDTLSESLNYSPNYLSTLIRKRTGKRFIEILHSCKLNNAKELLEKTDFSIDEIAKTVGYSNDSYLHKAFVTKYGISPTAYRKTVATK
jgi:AraC-like DNA-binding protein